MKKVEEKKKTTAKKFYNQLPSCLSGNEMLVIFEEQDRKKLEEMERKEENKKKCEEAHEQRIRAEAEKHVANLERKRLNEEAKKKREEEKKAAQLKREQEHQRKQRAVNIEKMKKKYEKLLAKIRWDGMPNTVSWDSNVQVSDKGIYTEDSAEDTAPPQKPGTCYKCGDDASEPMIPCIDCKRDFHEHYLLGYLQDKDIDHDSVPFSCDYC